MNTDHFEPSKGFRPGDDIFAFVRSATKVSRAGAASYIDDIRMRRKVDGPVVIVTEVEQVRIAWMRLINLDKGQRLYKFLPVVVNFEVFERMMQGSDIREWTVVFDDLGEGAEAYIKYGPRMRQAQANRPKLCMIVCKPPAREEVVDMLMPPSPRDMAEQIIGMSPAGFRLKPYQKYVVDRLKPQEDSRPDYPEALIRTKHTRFLADQGNGIVVMLVKSMLSEPGCESGCYTRWPKYAIVGDRLFLRSHARADVVDRHHEASWAYQYNLLEGAASTEARGDVKELLEALIYPDVQ